MKKLLSLLLVAIMSISIVGCSSESTNTNLSEDSISSNVNQYNEELSQNSNSTLYVVPDLTGKTQEEAFECLHSVGLEGQVHFDYDTPDTNPVLSQNQKPGTKLSKDEVVEFYIGIQENYFPYSSNSANLNQTDHLFRKVPKKVTMQYSSTDGSDNFTAYTNITWDLSNGILSGETKADVSDDATNSFYYTFDFNEDDTISKVSLGSGGERYRNFIYDSEGKVIEAQDYLNNDLDEKIYIEYNGLERYITSLNTDEVVRNIFDSNGNLVLMELVNDDGISKKLHERKYDEYSNVLTTGNDYIFESPIYDEDRLIEVTQTAYNKNTKIEYIYDYNYDSPNKIILYDDMYKMTLDIEYVDIETSKYESLIKISDIPGGFFGVTGIVAIKSGRTGLFYLSNIYNFFKP